MENKRCPNNKEFFMKHYLELGKSTQQIAEEFGFNNATVWRRVKKFKLIRSISEANLGEKNGMWKGNDVGYVGLHMWVERHKSKPQFCEECKKNKPYELANISGEYKRDINDYKWLCRICHMKSDGRIKNLKRGNNLQRDKKGRFMKIK